MKPIFVLVLLFLNIGTYAQNDEFNFKGKIVNKNNKPISDAYIINFRDLKKIVSDEDGRFNIWVQKSDSLMISHISYVRKKVYPVPTNSQVLISLEMDTVNMIRIDVSPNFKTDESRARDNMLFLNSYKVPAFTKIETETQPTQQMVLEHNKVLHSEATSITFLRFSPSTIFSKISKKIKRRKRSKELSSTKKK